MDDEMDEVLKDGMNFGIQDFLFSNLEAVEAQQGMITERPSDLMTVGTAPVEDAVQVLLDKAAASTAPCPSSSPAQ